jgi:hypothetical protein
MTGIKTEKQGSPTKRERLSYRYKRRSIDLSLVNLETL